MSNSAIGIVAGIAVLVCGVGYLLWDRIVKGNIVMFSFDKFKKKCVNKARFYNMDGVTSAVITLDKKNGDACATLYRRYSDGRVTKTNLEYNISIDLLSDDLKNSIQKGQTVLTKIEL